MWVNKNTPLKYKVLNVIIIVVVTILASCAVCLLFVFCNSREEQKEYQPYSEDERFSEISYEWHHGSAWVVMQDTETDKQYLWVGGRTLTPMENNNGR